jgi:hypothetical protein
VKGAEQRPFTFHRSLFKLPADRFQRTAEARKHSSSVITVLLFLPSVGDKGLERLGRDLVLTLSPTLDGVGESGTADAHTVLAPAARAPRIEP